MAYVPATSAPQVLESNPDYRLWYYVSADAAATVAGASYFTDGQTRGMQLNDLVIVVDTATPLITTHRVKTISTTDQSVTLSAGTTVGAT